MFFNFTVFVNVSVCELKKLFLQTDVICSYEKYLSTDPQRQTVSKSPWKEQTNILNMISCPEN